MLFPIEKLADIISQHTIAQIENKLRVLYISLRRSNLSEAETTKLHNKQKLYSYARSFLLTHASLPEAWSSSPGCFSQLAAFFHAQTDITDHEKWAMQAWYFRLHRSSFNNIASSLITLGEVFFEEPYQFSAFLLWLLKHNISFDAIHRSQVLHRYFAYYAAIEIETLQQTYVLLENISENVTAFLTALETAPGVSGFGSYNLRGARSSTIALFPLQQNNNALFAPRFLNEEMGLELFDVFRWTLIKKINLNDYFYQVMIQKILCTQSLVTPFLEGLSTAILTEVVDVQDAEILLSITAAHPAIETWMQREPFLIYGMSDFMFSHDMLFSALNKLCSQEKYKQLSHIRWLEYLSKIAGDFSCFAKMDQICVRHTLNKIHNQIAAYVLDLVLPFGTTLSDEIMGRLESLDETALRRCCEKKMREYSDALSCAITAFLKREMDYDAVEHAWGSVLGQVNLLRLLHPALLYRISYPKNKYALRGMIFQKGCIEVNLFSVQEMIDLMCDIFSEKKRTLQEVFSLYKNPNFQQSILAWVMALDRPTAFFHEPFGHDETVIGCLYFKKDSVALSLVLQKIPSALKEFLFCAAEMNWPELLVGLLKLRMRGVKSLIPSLVQHAAEKNNWEVVQLLCGLSDDFNYQSSGIRKNNIHLYIKILSDEKIRRGVICFLELKHLISWKNSAGDTLLHLAARYGQYGTVCTCLELFKSVSVTGDIILFLHHKNHAQQIAHRDGGTPNAIQINCFLQRERERLRAPSSPALHSFFTGLWDRLSQQSEGAAQNAGELFHVVP